jgi:hypothetical protein
MKMAGTGPGKNRNETGITNETVEKTEMKATEN